MELTQLDSPDITLQTLLDNRHKVEQETSEFLNNSESSEESDESEEDASNVIIPEDFPPAPPRVPPLFIGPESRKNIYIQRKQRYENWEIALKSYRQLYSEGKMEACQQIFQKLKTLDESSRNSKNSDKISQLNLTDLYTELAHQQNITLTPHPITQFQLQSKIPGMARRASVSVFAEVSPDNKEKDKNNTLRIKKKESKRALKLEFTTARTPEKESEKQTPPPVRSKSSRALTRKFVHKES